MKALSKENFKFFSIDQSEYNRIHKIYTDPGTVIAIVETGMKIYQMFNRKKAKRSQELLYLRKIHSEMIEMRGDIIRIINLLEDLRVYIDQRQVDFIANTLTSKINTVNLFLIGWLDTGNGNIEEQFSSIHETKSLLGIYGFAHVHVYMLALEKELDLCHWLKKGETFKQTLIDESLNYFNQALNPNHHLETPAKRLSVVNAQIAELENKFPAKSYTQQKKIVLDGPGCGADGYQTIEYTLVITGTLSAGFNFTISDRIIAYQAPESESCGRHFVDPQPGERWKKLEATLLRPASDAPQLDSVIQNYKDAYELHLHLSKAKMELNATVNTISGLVEIISKSNLP